MHTPDLVAAIERELDTVAQHIQKLTIYRTSLQQTLELHKQSRVLVSPNWPPRTLRPAPVDATSPLTEGPIPQDSTPSTIEMARTVLRNAGGTTMTLQEIRTAIQQTYGIDPAKTLDQMLYKRAQRNKGFYKTGEGRFGLTDSTPTTVMTEVAVPTTAMA